MDVFDELKLCRDGDDILIFLSKWNKKWVDRGMGFWPASSFAHIVFDDFNLSDGNIDFCVEYAKDWFAETIENLKKRHPAYTNYLSPHSWERFMYDDVLSMTKETLNVLWHLKRIPKSIRENLVDKKYIAHKGTQ